MNYRPYDDEPITDRRLSPVNPGAIWGALLVVSALGAVATVVTAPSASTTERVVAANDGRELRQSVRQLTAQRDELADRVAQLERGLGELKIATRAPGSVNLAEATAAAQSAEITGSIARPGESKPSPDARPASFAISLGPDATIEALRRRWGALASRHQQILGKLSPRAVRGDGGFTLLAGPFAARTDADRMCQTLAEQGFACDTTVFAGEPLGRP